MSLLDDVSIVVTPNGYKAGTLYGVIPTYAEGSEEIVNGSFTGVANGTDVSTLANWNNYNSPTSKNVVDNKLVIVAQGSNKGAYYDLGSLTGTYKLSVDVTGDVGAGGLFISATSSHNITTSVGTVEYYFAASGSTLIFFRAAANNVGTTSYANISIKEVTSSDMSVTRATAATRVDENGLVNYAQVQGSELVTNGDFSNGTTGWSSPDYNSTLSIVGGQLKIVNTITIGRVSQAITTVVGKTYLVSATVTNIDSSNGIQLKLSNAPNLDGAFYSSSGNSTTSPVTITHLFVATASTTYVGSSQSSGVGQSALLDNVSIKQTDRNNVPRIDYTGGGCPHILAEPQRTNLVTYSEDLSQWTIANGTLTPNATVSPDGTQNAGRVVFNNVGLDLKRTVTVVAGQTYTISFYIKLESGTGLQGRFYDNSNGANIEYYTYTSQIQGTEWSKITRSVTAPSGCTEMQIWLIAASSTLVTASFWGAQFELGSYATSYIPTSGSTVTRNQDIFTRDGIASLINSTEGVLFVEIAALSDDGTSRQLSLSDGSSANNKLSIIYTSTTNQIQAFIRAGGSISFNVTFSLTDATTFSKIAIKWKLNDFALWVDGTEVATDTSGATPTGLNTLSFDDADGNSLFFSKVKQLQVYKTALTDAQLTSLTT